MRLFSDPKLYVVAEDFDHDGGPVYWLVNNLRLHFGPLRVGRLGYNTEANEELDRPNYASIEVRGQLGYEVDVYFNGDFVS